MGWFKRNGNSLAARSRKIDQELASVQKRIRQLSLGLDGAPDPEPMAPPAKAPTKGKSHSEKPRRGRVTAAGSDSPFLAGAASRPTTSPWQSFKGEVTRWLRQLKDGRQPADRDRSKFVNYLAAGSFEGMRPLRYEKRIARNRMLFLVVCLLLVILSMVFLIWPG